MLLTRTNKIWDNAFMIYVSLIIVTCACMYDKYSVLRIFSRVTAIVLRQGNTVYYNIKVYNIVCVNKIAAPWGNMHAMYLCGYANICWKQKKSKINKSSVWKLMKKIYVYRYLTGRLQSMYECLKTGWNGICKKQSSA